MGNATVLLIIVQEQTLNRNESSVVAKLMAMSDIAHIHVVRHILNTHGTSCQTVSNSVLKSNTETKCTIWSNAWVICHTEFTLSDNDMT